MGNMHFLFISPHLDDTVFSCGAYIGKLCALGYPVSVLTIFSGSPAGNLSVLASMLHLEWGLPKDATEFRREEDRQALAVLGGKALHAGFLDSIYRRDAESGKPIYRRLKEILGQETVQETQLVKEIALYLAGVLQEGTYNHTFVPLGLGGHVDHLITHAAMRLVMERRTDTQFHFYEDLPYAISDAPEGERMIGKRYYFCTQSEGSSQKYNAMAKYVSQIKSVRYPGGIDIDAIVRYGMDFENKPGVFAERVWYPMG